MVLVMAMVMVVVTAMVLVVALVTVLVMALAMVIAIAMALVMGHDRVCDLQASCPNLRTRPKNNAYILQYRSCPLPAWPRL